MCIGDLMWLHVDRQLVGFDCILKGLVKGFIHGLHGDCDHRVIRTTQLAVLVQRRVLDPSVGQTVEEGVVGDEDDLSVRQVHVHGCLQEQPLSLSTNQHGVHA